MTNFETSPKNQETPQAYNLLAWRERILQILLIVILSVGIPMYLVNLPQFIAVQNWVFLIIATIGFLFATIVTFLRNKTPYTFRAISVITISFLFTVLAFQNYGLTGDARIWLLFFVVFTTIMLGLQAGIIATGIGIITYVTIGYLILNDILLIQVPVAIAYSSELGSWITAGVTLLFTSLILSISIGLLIRGLESNLTELQESYETAQSLGIELEQEHEFLEQRSRDLERRVTQIRTAAEISRSLGTILDSQTLLQNVVDLIKNRFDLYYIGVFLVDDNKRYAVLSAGSDEAGQRMLQEGHRLSIGGSSMVGWATAHGKPRIALDVGQEAIRFRNPHLPLTRSELALPIAIGNQILGAISVQSTESEAFDDDDIIVLQGIADSLAIALENANLFQQFEESLKEIQYLNRQYLGEAWSGILAETEQEMSYSKDLETTNEGQVQEVNIPLVLRGDQVIGNITLETDQDELNPEEREFIDAISTQAALALESARLLDEANKRLEREQSLHQLTTKFAQTLDFETLLQKVVIELSQIPQVKEASIFVTPPGEIDKPENGKPLMEESPSNKEVSGDPGRTKSD
jgi:GAF domain-containing protein